MKERGKARLKVIIPHHDGICATYNIKLDVGTLRDLEFEDHHVTIVLESVEISGIEVKKEDLL